MFNRIKLGTLVFDVDPYKAPEVLYGIGLVIRIISKRYVEVQWTQWSFTSIEKIENLEVVSESG